MFTLVDLKELQAARINEEQGTIVIFLRGQAEAIYINEDDSLYEVYKNHFKKERERLLA